MQRFSSDSELECLVARAIAVGNYLAVVAPFQTLTPLPKCCFKNAKVQQFLFQILTTTLFLEVVAPAFG
ncbi:hypothetical protein GTQ43_25540 [Nostoc sp. KVJ3]|uniref:hypothetical protein n=1 Tax=Nostoc sp. KVJ3 TaxID=457945 RepID=UPI0022380812|nr:hypothetical protein [Nostoc sp. KVJ3]MCW5317059.1 hypothetical protein [Nostoc sp. KVJ3]